jgi:hypothetical protein
MEAVMCCSSCHDDDIDDVFAIVWTYLDDVKLQ